MKDHIQDERVIQEKRLQRSTAFTILYFGILVALLYRQFILQDPVSSYWDLAILFYGVTFYLAAKNVGSGFFVTASKRIIPTSIVAAIVFLFTNYWWFDRTSPTELIVGGITFFVGFCAFLLLMKYLSKKINEKILKD